MARAIGRPDTSSPHEDGRVKALRAVRVQMRPGQAPAPIAGTEFEIPCELVLLAMGFVGSEREGLLEQLGVEIDPRGNVKTVQGRTSVNGVFAAGDQARGQSLVVWAIAEGRTWRTGRRAFDGRGYEVGVVG